MYNKILLRYAPNPLTLDVSEVVADSIPKREEPNDDPASALSLEGPGMCVHHQFPIASFVVSNFSAEKFCLRLPSV